MNDLNYIRLLFSFMVLFMISLGSLMNSFEKYLPSILRQTFRYGKFAYKGQSTFLVNTAEIPKSCFKHFYVYSSFITSATLLLMLSTFCFNYPIPQFVYSSLDNIAGHSRQATVNNASSLLAMFLLTVQCCRRLYDTHCISVFGKNSKMNLSHYLAGLIHYTGAVLAILVETPKFVKGYHTSQLHLRDLTYTEVIASLFFLWACWHQFKVTVILANLRKNNHGTVVTQQHKLPHGDWFNYVSSPHLLAEILMYFSLTIILWNNVTWLYVFAWVLSNQVETALLSHWWYQENFKDLPKNRRAIVPFIY